MKNKFIILLFFSFAIQAEAQYPNGAENNYYVYGEKDGVNTSNNGIAKILRSGQILNWVYGGLPYLVGNNYTRQLEIPNAKNLALTGLGYSILNTDSSWITTFNKAYLFNKYQLIDSIVLSKSSTLTTIVTDNNINYLFSKNYAVIGLFYRHRLKLFAQPRFKHNTLFQQIFYNSKGNLCVGTLSEYCTLDTNGCSKLYYNKGFTGNEFILNTFCNDSVSINQNYPKTGIYKIVNNKILFTGLYAKQFGVSAFDNYVPTYQNGHANIYKITAFKNENIASFAYKSNINVVYPGSCNTYYLSSSSSILRVFEGIKKYPKIYNNNANHTFTLQQDNKGRIWAGSYNGGIGIVDSHKISFVNTPYIKMSNGGCVIHDKIYLIGEGEYNGLLQYSNNGSYRKITKNVTGFINYVDTTNKLLYFGTHQKGLYFTNLSNLNKKQVNWHVIDNKNGLNLFNILTITKDKKDRIWLGHSSRGWAVYYPKLNKATTFLIENNETNFGTLSSCTDTKGTVWLGTKQQGLLYYNNFETDIVNPKAIQSIDHPLLPKNKTITAMVQHGNWLIMGVTHYYVAFDLATWYNTGKVLVKYLNPQEANFTSETEQNTLLVDKRDSSVWFSTTDMLYQWDFKTWLQLPVYIAKPNAILHVSNLDTALQQNDKFSLHPTQNSFEISVWFQTLDNMPRYLAAGFGNATDRINYSSIGLQTKYSYNNLAPGSYIFRLLICQSDGNVSYHNYHITIKNFWWQNWYVWVIGCFFLVAPFLIWVNEKRKRIKLISQQKIKEAELANLQLITLGNQFRPHFILNALYAIGAKMKPNSKEEDVLNNLGESVNIIFNHTHSHSITHSFKNEWKLVINIIQIHKMMYLESLKFLLPDNEILRQIESIDIPMGLLQIPVENALLHGLNNKEIGEQFLKIDIENNSVKYFITITDTGIGRKKAATLSNSTKHGTGIKTLESILQIINSNKADNITIDYNDNLFDNSYGTQVIITIPKYFDYNV